MEKVRMGGYEALKTIQILDRRLAEGSISADENKERREILEESNR